MHIITYINTNILDHYPSGIEKEFIKFKRTNIQLYDVAASACRGEKTFKVTAIRLWCNTVGEQRKRDINLRLQELRKIRVICRSNNG